MSKVLESIDARLARFLMAQPVFFVGTAPLAGGRPGERLPEGHGRHVRRPRAARGSPTSTTPGPGAETIAHLRENGRIVLMFCAFDGAAEHRPPARPRTGRAGRRPEFAQLRTAFPKEREKGQRSIVVVDVERVSDSCGFAVPLMDLREDRDLLDRHAERHDEDYFENYWRTRNATSIDGLEALPWPGRAQKASALPET